MPKTIMDETIPSLWKDHKLFIIFVICWLITYLILLSNTLISFANKDIATGCSSGFLTLSWMMWALMFKR